MNVKYITNPTTLCLYKQELVSDFEEVYEKIRETIKTIKNQDPELRDIINKSTRYNKPVNVPEEYKLNSKYDIYCTYAYYMISKSDMVDLLMSTVRNHYPDINEEMCLDLGVVVIATFIRQKMSKNNDKS